MPKVIGCAECVHAEGARGITMGKSYPFRPDKATGYIQIKNDLGLWKSYHGSRFNILSKNQQSK